MAEIESIDRSFTQQTVENSLQMQSSKAFVCDFPSCGKSFTKSSNLAQHHLIHTGERPYSCDLCGRCFRQTGNLTKHLRSHQSAHLRWNRESSEKPFKCDYPGCIKSFTAKSSMQKHMLIHKRVESSATLVEPFTSSPSDTDAETADPIAATSIKIEHSDAIGAMIAASSSNWTREAYTQQQQQQLPPEQNRKRGSSELTSSTISSCNYEGRQIPAAADQSGDSDLGGSSGQGLLKRARENDRREYCDMERDDMDTLLDVLLYDFDDYNVAEPNQLTASMPVLNPKYQNQPKMVPPQSTDSDDYNFIKIIEHYLQENEDNHAPLFFYKNTDSSTATSSSSSSRTDMTSPYGDIQTIESDDNNYIDILEQLCRSENLSF